MMFDQTDRQRELRASGRVFAQDVLRDIPSQTDHLLTAAERFAATRPAYEKMVTEGFLRACLPQAVGGDAESLMDTAILVEELYAGNAGVALSLIGTVLGVQPIVVAGSKEQRARLLKPFLSNEGAPLAGFCSSEPGGSANAAALPPAEGVRTTARLENNKWIINGRKRWVSSATGWDGNGADVLCVVCRTDPEATPDKAVSIIAMRRPVKGLVLEGTIESPGHRAHFLPDFSLKDVVAPRRNLIGREGGGLALSAASFSDAAALIGILGVALMRSAFDFTLNFARTQRRGGAVPIIEHQAVGYALVDAKTSIEAARSLSWRACAAAAGHPAAGELANQSKIFGSETAVRVITDLLRIVGVESYDLSTPLNGLLQDALALPVFAGGNVGVRRRALHALLQSPTYDPLATADGH